MHFRYAVATAGLAGTLAISACGSSSKSSSTSQAPSPVAGHTTTSIPAPAASTALEAGLIARANAVCERAKRRVDAAHSQFPYTNFDPVHPDVKLLPKVGAFFARVRAITDRVPGELAQLGTPSRAQATWGEMVALAKRDRVIADRQIAAARASDVPGFIASVHAIEQTDMQLGRLAITAGFAESSPCTKIL
jgi:hypothetical protein